MPKFLQRRWHGYHTVWAFMLLLALIIIVSIYNWALGVVSLFLAGTLCFYMLKTEISFRRNLVEYINGLTFRIKRVEGEAVSMLPLGIILFSEDRTVEWNNRYAGDIFARKSLVGEPLLELLPDMQSFLRRMYREKGMFTKKAYCMTLALSSLWMNDFTKLSLFQVNVFFTCMISLSLWCYVNVMRMKSWRLA